MLLQVRVVYEKRNLQPLNTYYSSVFYKIYEVFCHPTIFDMPFHIKKFKTYVKHYIKITSPP